MTIIRVKRVYEPFSSDDGYRVFVERLWPRGMRREELRMDLWAKDLAPSNPLRVWYSHDPAKWDEFRSKYKTELCEKEEILNELRKIENLTLLVASKSDLNAGAVIKDVLEHWNEFMDLCSSVKNNAAKM